MAPELLQNKSFVLSRSGTRTGFSPKQEPGFRREIPAPALKLPKIGSGVPLKPSFCSDFAASNFFDVKHL